MCTTNASYRESIQRAAGYTSRSAPPECQRLGIALGVPLDKENELVVTGKGDGSIFHSAFSKNRSVPLFPCL